MRSSQVASRLQQMSLRLTPDREPRLTCLRGPRSLRTKGRVVVPVASVARRGLLWHTISVAGEQIEMRGMLFLAALLVACAGKTESDAGVLTTEPKAPPDTPPGDEVPPSEPTEPPPAEVPEAPVDP